MLNTLLTILITWFLVSIPISLSIGWFMSINNRWIDDILSETNITPSTENDV
jgi:hypothetical protein